MKKIILLGSGKIGEAIVTLLDPFYDLTVIDQHPFRSDLFRCHDRTFVQDLNTADLVELFKGHEAVISACPHALASEIAQAAYTVGIHYLDLTEDVESTRKIRDIAIISENNHGRSRGISFIPQCGLAPGFISIAANHLVKKFKTIRDVKMRVGALPIYPGNALNYNLTWSTDGLINEYCNPCEAIVNGELREVPSLEELEELSLDGVTYEAFNTSGGLGTMCSTIGGLVENLNYKTIRYPGHCAIMKVLIKDLRLGQRREVLKSILENAIPITQQDLVIVFVSVTGERDRMLVQETLVRKIYGQVVNGRYLSAIQLTTAAGICAIVDLLFENQLHVGLVRQEFVPLEKFVANRFGAYYEEKR